MQCPNLFVKKEGYLLFSKSDEDDSRLIVNDYVKMWNEQQAHTSPLNILTLDKILIPDPFLLDPNTKDNLFEKNEMTQQSLHCFLRGLDEKNGLVYCRSNTHISIFYFQKIIRILVSFLLISIFISPFKRKIIHALKMLLASYFLQRMMSFCIYSKSTLQCHHQPKGKEEVKRVGVHAHLLKCETYV